MLNRFKVNKTFKNRSKMHYVSKESSNKELIWIRKMTKRKKKTIKWKKRTKCLLANFKKRDFIQKEKLGIS